MEKYLTLIFILLLVSLITYLFPKNKFDFLKKLFRNAVLLCSIFFFILWIFRSSVHIETTSHNTLKIINKTPQIIDVFMIQKPSNTQIQHITHIGKIRPEHYGLENIQTKSEKNFWIVGYLSKNELVYFTEIIPTKREQIIENYSITNKDLSKKADEYLQENKKEKNKKSILVTFSFLFIFIHIVLYFKYK